MARRSSIVPIDRQRDFQPHELFFSITNERGIILHGNSVFTRISGYSEQELFGAPHSLIRHPDMPRAVFQLLWKTIESNKTIAAYVKNMASDGAYYWVLAVVMPCQGGYLSIRLNPLTSLRGQVDQLYKRMQSLEQSILSEGGTGEAAMIASGRELQNSLLSLGFGDYDEFMMHALTTELTAHHLITAKRTENDHNQSASLKGASNENTSIVGYEKWNSLLEDAFKRLGVFQALSQTLVDKSECIRTNAENMRVVSMNASIASNKMGEIAATLRVVADSLGQVSMDTHRVVSELSERMVGFSNVLKKLVFDVAATKLQSEVGTEFCIEVDSSGPREDNVQLQRSLSILDEELTTRTRKILQQIQWSQNELKQLLSHIARLLANNRALRFVRFAGTKEAVDEETSRIFVSLFASVQHQIEETQSDCDFLLSSIREAAHNMEQLDKTFAAAIKIEKAA